MGQNCSQIYFFVQFCHISSVLHFFRLRHSSKFRASFAKHQPHFNLFVYLTHQKFRQITFFWQLYQISTVLKLFCYCCSQNFKQIAIFEQFCHTQILQQHFILFSCHASIFWAVLPNNNVTALAKLGLLKRVTPLIEYQRYIQTVTKIRYKTRL